MKKIFSLGVLAIMIVVGISFLPTITKADSLESKLSGRILLAVEANGETWYVNPINKQRYLINDSIDVLNIMQNLGLGISNSDFDSFKGKAPLKLSGKILLKVQSLGEAYYVNPTDLKMHYLGRPDQALKLMQGLSLGITNNNLTKIAMPNSKDIGITTSGFNPTNLVIAKGDMVTWTNYTNASKTIISPSHFNLGNIISGRARNSFFNAIGTYHYYSSDNTEMTGTITVK